MATPAGQGFRALTATDLDLLAQGMSQAAWRMSERDDIAKAIKRDWKRCDRMGIPRATVARWKYHSITPTARMALQLYATGLFPLKEAVARTHDGLEPPQIDRTARRLLRMVREGHPAVRRAMTEGYEQMKTPLDLLAEAKVSAATESMTLLRAMLQDEEVPLAERAAQARDFLDRLPETSKVSRTEMKNTGPAGIQLPAEAAARMALAVERASRFLVRDPAELALAARGTDPLEVPEAQAKLLPPGEAP